MGHGRIKRKYKKGNLKPKKFLVYPNGYGMPPEWICPINSIEKISLESILMNMNSNQLK
jgi:hypothetical protein